LPVKPSCIAFIHRRQTDRTRQKRRHRHRAHHPLQLRLQHGHLQAGAPAVRQRDGRRRHSRRRRLSGFDGAADCGQRPKANRSSSRKRFQASLILASPASMNGPPPFLNSRTASLPKSPARSWRNRTTRCASSARWAHRGQGFLVRLRPQGRRRQDRDFQGNEQQTIEIKEDRWLYSFEVDAAGDAIRAGGRNSLPAWVGRIRLGNLRVLDQWRARSASNTASRRLQAHAISPAILSVRGNSVPKRRSRDLQAGLRGHARLRVLPELLRAASLTLDAFYEAGGNVFDTGFRLWRRQDRGASSAIGTPAAMCRGRRSC
jgi:hypothetical protein